MLRLAGPVVAAELGWMAMGIVDTMMVGRLSAEAMGAVSVGGILFHTAAIAGVGLMLGLDPMVARAFGAGRLHECHRAMFTGLYLSLPLTLLIMTFVWNSAPLLAALGLHPAVLELTGPYLSAIVWSTLPLLLYTVFRRYLQGMSLVQPVMFALITANAVNFLTNWVLIFGRWGAPALGVAGAGWATLASRIYMAGVLLGYMVYHDRRHQTGMLQGPLRPVWERARELLSLGVPAALQIGLEVGVFALVTMLIGRISPEELAAHQVALSMAGFTFMVPLGVGSAAAVRVGQALGRGDPAGAGRAGWTALLLGEVFMSCAGAVFLLAPGWIIRLFTTDPRVLSVGVSLLTVAAVFQLFDGLQVVATGALRGAGDTRTPMLCHLAGYWFVGLPLGYRLGFGAGWGAAGLWIGLCLALILIGSVLLWVWKRKVRSFTAEMASAR
jgi:MATE family multidrug resistance protein